MCENISTGQKQRYTQFVKKILALLVLPFCATIQAATTDDLEIPTVTVSGTATMEVDNDIATANMLLSQTATEQLEASAALAAPLNKFTTWAKEFPGLISIETADISTTAQSNRPASNEVSKTIGYRAQARITVKVPSNQLAEFLLQAQSHGNPEVQGTSFEVSPSLAAESEDSLLAKSFENARHKADVLAKASGGKLAPAYRITASQNFAAPVRAMAMMAMESSGQPAYETAAGETTINASVEVTFELLRSR